MSNISRMALFSKLNATAFKSVEGATVLCKLRGNPYVELVHWLVQILQQDDSDWHHILRYFSVDASGVIADLNKALERLPAGAHGISDLRESIADTVERAWMYGSLIFAANRVRTGHVLIALLKTDFLTPDFLRLCPHFRMIREKDLVESFNEICASSVESQDNAVPPAESLAGQTSGAIVPAQLGAQQALKRYTQDLTEKARQGEIDPVTGRDMQVRQIVDILLRRRQNNPLITGEAGVGKTAVVEGFALQVAAGNVPPALRQVQVLSLDLGLLQAGASMKGEFEQRLRQVIDEVQASITPVILFIDEVHTLVGAGGNQGTGDAANLLKPALARGKLRTIGATTWAEYKKYIEKDPALTRRFQVVQVAEPAEEVAIDMLRGVAPALEKHHQVLLLDEAVQAAVRLSHRYIPARQLPDKAISLLDTACARVAVSQHATPAAIAATQLQMEALNAELNVLEKESRLGRQHTVRCAEIQQELEKLSQLAEKLQQQWRQEKDLLTQILQVRQQDCDAIAPCVSHPKSLEQLHTLLAAVQADQPLVYPQVDAQCVASVVADWTGIPVGRMVRNDVESVLNLADTLSQRIVGQQHALNAIALRIQTHRARLDDPDKPVGVFMLAGTSGVGKTETALALAESLYGGEHKLITINMSEYQEAHTVSCLKGAPPGYVGYGEGGVLTEAVRRKPYSVVLLDEVEKAHPDVHELFFQVFDKGWMEDGEGRKIDFRNCLILLTTNVGTGTLMTLCQQGNLWPEMDTVNQAIRPALLKVFPPALLGRLEVLPYYPLSADMLALIVNLQLERIRQRIFRQHKIRVHIEPGVVEKIVQRCTQADSGGRIVSSILSNSMLPAISRQLLNATLSGQCIAQLTIGTDDRGFTYHYV